MDDITAQPKNTTNNLRNSLKNWFLEGQIKEVEGPHEKAGQHQAHAWWKVMCLTGVDYFSTLGYQQKIFAAIARHTAFEQNFQLSTGIIGASIALE